VRVGLLGSLLLCTLAAVPLAAQPVGDVAAVTAVVNAFHDGIHKGDATAVAQVIADDALMLEASGIARLKPAK
jgi:hypothetical protein